jgi:hypothetical protein
MQIHPVIGAKNINFIPREAIIPHPNMVKTYKIDIKAEAQNKIIFTDSDMSITELDYYYQYVLVEEVGAPAILKENNYYTITITNTTDNTIIFKDKMYCTNQTLSDYQISNGVYIEQSTGDNNFVYYG